MDKKVEKLLMEVHCLSLEDVNIIKDMLKNITEEQYNELEDYLKTEGIGPFEIYGEAFNLVGNSGLDGPNDLEMLKKEFHEELAKLKVTGGKLKKIEDILEGAPDKLMAYDGFLFYLEQKSTKKDYNSLVELANTVVSGDPEGMENLFNFENILSSDEITLIDVLRYYNIDLKTVTVLIAELRQEKGDEGCGLLLEKLKSVKEEEINEANLMKWMMEILQ